MKLSQEPVTRPAFPSQSSLVVQPAKHYDIILEVFSAEYTYSSLEVSFDVHPPMTTRTTPPRRSREREGGREKRGTERGRGPPCAACACYRRVPFTDKPLLLLQRRVPLSSGDAGSHGGGWRTPATRKQNGRRSRNACRTPLDTLSTDRYTPCPCPFPRSSGTSGSPASVSGS